MDAATLYIVLTLANGEQKASIVKEPTWAACRQHIAFLKELQRLDPEAPIVRYRCMFRMPSFEVQICEPWYSGRCDRYRTSTRRGCEAMRWIAHMRNRKQLGRCYQEPGPPAKEEEPRPRSE